MGHVLGFEDRYYTRWVPEKCAYEVTYSGEDLMSGGIGKVTVDEWKELDEAYSWTGQSK